MNHLLKWLIDFPSKGSLGMRNKTHLFRVQIYALTIGVLCPLSKCSGMEQSHPCCVCWLFGFFGTENFSHKPFNYKSFEFPNTQENSLHYTRPPCRSRSPLDNKHMQGRYNYCLRVILYLKSLVFESLNIHPWLKIPMWNLHFCSLFDSGHI